MKKAILLSVIIGGLIVFTACSKNDRTCSCTNTYGPVGDVETYQSSFNSTGLNGDDAESWCKGFDENYSDQYVTDTRVCELLN